MSFQNVILPPEFVSIPFLLIGPDRLAEHRDKQNSSVLTIEVAESILIDEHGGRTLVLLRTKVSTMNTGREAKDDYIPQFGGDMFVSPANKMPNGVPAAAVFRY